MDVRVIKPGSKRELKAYGLMGLRGLGPRNTYRKRSAHCGKHSGGRTAENGNWELVALEELQRETFEVLRYRICRGPRSEVIDRRLNGMKSCEAVYKRQLTEAEEFAYTT